MIEVAMLFMGLWLLIVFTSVCVWIVDMGSEYDDWQKNVSVDDLRELDKILKN